MIYVTSDWHGYPLEKIEKKLADIGFCETDRLYILGDCIDRGDDGAKILRWCMSRPNVTLLMGNHEVFLLQNEFVFDGDGIPMSGDLTGERKETYDLWMRNGGYATVDGFSQFPDAQIKYIMSYVRRAPLYAEVDVNGKRYVLVHAGLGGFEADKPLSEYQPHDLLWERPDGDTQYYEDGRTVIFGHTPTALFGPQYRGKPIYTKTWIDIDVGASIGMPPLILRLDDMREFFV